VPGTTRVIRAKTLFCLFKGNAGNRVPPPAKRTGAGLASSGSSHRWWTAGEADWAKVARGLGFGDPPLPVFRRPCSLEADQADTKHHCAPPKPVD